MRERGRIEREAAEASKAAGQMVLQVSDLDQARVGDEPEGRDGESVHRLRARERDLDSRGPGCGGPAEALAGARGDAAEGGGVG